MKGSDICNKNECTGCGLCVEVCPNRCIEMEEDYDGFLYPDVDTTNCSSCGMCKRSCPNNKTLEKNSSTFYMAINKNKEILMKSSSGGAFSAIAEYVLAQNGIVVGAYFDTRTKEVRHIFVDKKDDLDLLRLSKYYQSNTIGIYKETQKFLKAGKLVLFSGTACQIASIKVITPNALLKNLLTVDVLCHGVASKKVVDSYIYSEEKKYKKRIKNYQFRIKDSYGWNNGSRMTLFFEDGTTKTYGKNEIDSYFLAYNNNCILRESCYECKYCGTNRVSDFTIADFWGVSNNRATVEEKMQGISLLVCNSPKSKECLPELKKYLLIEQINPEEAIPYNKAFVEPNTRNSNRDVFFRLLCKGKDFNYIVKKLYWKKYCKNQIKRLIGPRVLRFLKGKKNEQ